MQEQARFLWSPQLLSDGDIGRFIDLGPTLGGAAVVLGMHHTVWIHLWMHHHI